MVYDRVVIDGVHMLTRKKVVIDETHMHLWDEADNFVCSYDMRVDGDMRRFLQDMVTCEVYRLEENADVATRGLAA